MENTVSTRTPRSFPGGLSFWLVSVLLLAAGGCAAPPMEISYYDIRLPQQEESGAAPADREAGGDVGSLEIVSVAVPPHMDGPEIFYRSTEHRAGFYGYHHWVRTLSSALGSELAIFLERTGRFHPVTAPGEKGPPPALRLQVRIREFNEEDAGEGKWFAAIALCCRIEDCASGRTRFFTLDKKVGVQPRNAAGTVKALNRAFFLAVLDILANIERFMEEGEGIK